MMTRLAQALIENVIKHIDFDIQITEETAHISVKYKGVLVVQKTINYKLQNFI